MKKIISLIAILILVTAVYAGNVDKYGKPITIEKTTKIHDLVVYPDMFEGKEVLIEGSIIGVCEKRGCWMKIAGEKDGESMTVKVDDGVMVFPMEAMGKKAKVQGKVYFVEVEKKAEENEHKDNEDHAEGESCGGCADGGDKNVSKIWMIKVTGAEIS